MNIFRQTSESDGQGYFHPSMLEDPWARLEQQRASTSFTRPEKATNDKEQAEKQLSDSMIPQVQFDRSENWNRDLSDWACLLGR